MKLYQADLSPFAARVRVQLRAKGISEVELVAPPGGLGSDEYKALTPIGKIPLLEVDGKYIAESSVICEYIEDRWPAPSLLPNDPMARAQVRFLIQCVDMYVTTPMFKTIPQLTAKPRNQEYLDLLLQELKSGLRNLADMRDRSGLAGSRYAIGDALTLADGAIAPPELDSLFEALKEDELCGQAIEELT